MRLKVKLNESIWYIFIFLNYIAAIGVASLAMRGGYETRSDMLMYGRYSEFTYGPIFLVGIIYLYTISKNNSTKILGGILIILALCLICFDNTYVSAPNTNFWANCVAIGDIRAIPNITNKEVVLIATLKSICVIALLAFGLCFKRLRRLFINSVLILVIFLWIHNANVNWNENVAPWYVPMETAMYDIVEDMEDENIFLIMDVELAGCMQFLLPNVSLKPCSNIEEVLNYPKGTYIITGVTSEYVSYIRKAFTIDKENERYLRWKCE